jgi:hypothetical protein
VDGQVAESAANLPQIGFNWPENRAVRAELLQQLLQSDSTAQPHVRAIRLRGMRITGALRLEAEKLAGPLALLDCYFDEALALDEVSLPSLRLTGSHVPALSAHQLVVRGDVNLGDGFTAKQGVNLAGARIGGGLLCTRGHFSSGASDYALDGEGLVVAGDILCNDGFVAEGEVNFFGIRADGVINCTGGHFLNPGAVALNADALVVRGDLTCGGTFRADGEVRLVGASIAGQLSCEGGHFNSRGGPALTADALTVKQGLFFVDGFAAEGAVRLIRAQIDTVFHWGKATLSNPGGIALLADGISINGDLVCNSSFKSEGQVRLRGANINGQLTLDRGLLSNPGGPVLSADGIAVRRGISMRKDFIADGEIRLVGAELLALTCDGSHISNPNGLAFNFDGAVVTNEIVLRPATLSGDVNLTRARTGFYKDAQSTWPAVLHLDGFSYDGLDPLLPVATRLAWLTRNATGYAPQIYDRLADVYRRAGRDDNAREVAITKERRRREKLNPAGRAWSILLDWTVGYGYNTWQALIWVLVFLVFGTVAFDFAHPELLTPADPAAQLEFQPTMFTLDLLLPVLGLHQKEAWLPHGPVQWLMLAFTIIGWILATAVVLGLSGLLKRTDS